MRAPLRLLLVFAMLAAACGPTVDLTKGLQVLDVSTGWHDAGIVNGQNKLVPSVTLRVKNVSDQPLVVLQVNALFRRLNDPEEWGSGFISVTQSEGLAPGATSKPITLNSQLGYTGTEPRVEMLKNSQFVDAKVELFAKYGSTQWARIAEHAIERRLLAP